LGARQKTGGISHDLLATLVARPLPPSSRQEAISMRVEVQRLLAFLGLVTLYSLSPVLGVIALGAGFSYVIVRQRARATVEGTLTTLNLV
jgi:hypothetical protein